MSVTYSARAEWEPLRAVRLHTPGLETWGGALDPSANHFECFFPPQQAAAGHRAYIEALEGAGVNVHLLADDLAQGDRLEPIVREYVTIPDSHSFDDLLAELSPRELLQLALARAEIHADGDPSSLTIRQPISNIYYQRDTTILGDRGPIICNMYSSVRQREVDIVRQAWEAIGADIVHEATAGPIEGGEFMPAGEFALLGVSGIVDGEEHIVRTSRAAGIELLEENTLDFDTVGLVRAPVETELALRKEHDGPSRMMHLLGWFNIAARDIAVTFPAMAKAATVELFEQRNGSYSHTGSPTLWDFIHEQGFEVVEADWSERWPTNFVATGDAEIVPLYEPDAGGRYRPERNPTIETLKDLGVTIHPDGCGIPNGAVTNGAGGFHCMTTPVRRG